MGAVAVKESKADKVEAARAKAVELCAAAYAPQPVPQPGGAPALMLCWSGRIARGYERLAAARTAKDPAAIEVITKAIRKLEADYTAASAEAEAAAAAWAALATANGTTEQGASVYPPTCTCDGCKTAQAWHDHNEARGAYSDALYALLAPNSSERPPLYDLLEAFGKSEANRDRFWAELKKLYDAAGAYSAACKAAGVPPNWRAALFPGEE